MYCPMSGKMCFDPKVVTAYKVINGHPTKIELCTDCSCQLDNYAAIWQKFLMTIFALLNIDKILTPEEYHQAIVSIKDKDQLNLFLEELAQRKVHVQNRGPCPVCSTELRMILNGQRVGCPDCYKHFYEFIRALVIRAQDGADLHEGKKKKSPEQEIAQLEENLKLATSEERYEDCIKIRDQLKEMNNLS